MTAAAEEPKRQRVEEDTESSVSTSTDHGARAAAPGQPRWPELLEVLTREVPPVETNDVAIGTQVVLLDDGGEEPPEEPTQEQQELAARYKARAAAVREFMKSKGEKFGTPDIAKELLEEFGFLEKKKQEKPKLDYEAMDTAKRRKMTPMYSGLLAYFPDALPKNRNVSREYFWNILHTIHPVYVQRLISHAQQQRFGGGAEDQKG